MPEPMLAGRPLSSRRGPAGESIPIRLKVSVPVEVFENGRTAWRVAFIVEGAMERPRDAYGEDPIQAVNIALDSLRVWFAVLHRDQPFYETDGREVESPF